MSKRTPYEEKLVDRRRGRIIGEIIASIILVFIAIVLIMLMAFALMWLYNTLFGV